MNRWELRVKREGYVFPFWLYLKGQQRVDRLFNISFRYKNLKWVDGSLYYSDAENREFMEEISYIIDKDPEKFNKIVEDNIKAAERLNILILKIRNIDLKTITKEEIIALFKEYTDLKIDFYGFWAINVPTGWVIERKVREEIAKKTENVDEHFPSLIYPNKELELFQEMIELYKIGAFIEDIDAALLEDTEEMMKNKAIIDLLEIHTEKYAWLNSTYHINDPCTIKTFIDRLKQHRDYESKLYSTIENREKIEGEIQNLITNLSLDEKAQKLIHIMRSVVFLRNFEKENANKNQFLVEPLIIELARRLDIDRDIVLSMTDEEIIDALQKERVDIDEIKKRLENFAIIVKDSRMTIDLKPKADEKEEILDKEIKGNVACKGTVEGIVKVVKDRSEISKVKKGEILVTSMTTPDFVPAMEKAAAIITDEGGITCHAAIVSRELATPCIIGTKNATKILKDGDKVRVDAEKGIVLFI